MSMSDVKPRDRDSRQHVALLPSSNPIPDGVVIGESDSTPNPASITRDAEGSVRVQTWSISREYV